MNHRNSHQVVQVVRVCEHSYMLDELALGRILLREDVKDLPVVVVSVAGAYRGGKSFLINFFLRYLKAPMPTRNDGSWLGAAGEPLTGFSWRGGSERNTTGILMWSEPIISTLPSGQKVAVLLMDTQGTFDSQSTVRDCSTIFALSTLLSSVQIYNLSQLIKEDDLQHLQLFTEYGRLIKQRSGKAFQVLKFLVRDWPHPFEHPYGVDGGNLYLRKVLEVRSDGRKELREVREHIQSSFDNVNCFLMPHPGLDVLEPTFKGDVDEISVKFKKSLVELVTSLFASNMLVPKMINDEKVKARELYNYFKSYMNLFNSDKIPTPVSILEATSEAGMMAATTEARELYKSQMDRTCGSAQPSVPPTILKDLHQDALNTARSAFTNKKKMGSKKQADKHLEKLTKELKEQLPQYMSLNFAKVQKAVIDAKEAYEESIRTVSKNQMLCLHPLDLERVHKEAVAVAIKIFDANRMKMLNKADDERTDFIKSFEKNYKLLCLTNDQNNKMIVTEIRMEYSMYMQNLCTSKPPLSKPEFHQKHEEALENALAEFKKKRNHPDLYREDVYKAGLIQKINTNYVQLVAINESNNKEAFQSAVAAYNEHIASAWDHRKVCLHPDDLEQDHDTAKYKALQIFRATPSEEDYDTTDSDLVLLFEVLGNRYAELTEINESANKSAVQAAYNAYCTSMENDCRPSIWWLFIIPIIVYAANKPNYHNNAKKTALDIFTDKRRNGSCYSPDPYKDNLESMMNNAYSNY